MLTFGSLFAGIGGMDLGLERAGMRCAWQVEIDDYARRVLAKHWPDVRKWEDVRTFPPEPVGDWRVDLIAGGFPCQPVSLAGKGLGEKDERWLWPEFARVLRVLRPRYTLLENVPGLFVRGFPGVLGDLADLGFDAEWGVLPAAAFGAPHIRKRVFIVGYRSPASDSRAGEKRRMVSHPSGRGQRPDKDFPEGSEMQDQCPDLKRDSAIVPDAQRLGLRGEGHGAPAGAPAGVQGEAQERQRFRADAGAVREPVPDADRQGLAVGQERILLGELPAPVGSGWWATEPDMGRVAHGVPRRVDRLRALGNAVVPQVAEWIGERILAVVAQNKAEESP